MKTNPPWQTKLSPYLDEVRTLRQHRKTYEEVSAILLENHGLKVAPSTIHNAVKVRARRAGPYALPAPKPTTSVSSASIDAIEKLRSRLSQPVQDNSLAILLENKPLLKK